ncbi:MAG: hypothetical protein PWQ45_655 [Thermosipho sp. (in: thermotogales)]|nr:hypothetical protein [Thermosipho sp. (in: thermotogales)]
MNYVRVIGGLGNQMFQYAFGKSLERAGKKVVYDISGFADYNLHNGFELERIFGINLTALNGQSEFLFRPEISPVKRFVVKKILHGKYKNIFIQPDAYTYYPEVYEMDNFYLDGYWQNLDYIRSVEDEIRGLYNFDSKMQKLDEKNRELLSVIVNSNSVGVHIRGGDYVRSSRARFFHNVINSEYYLNAIRCIFKEVSSPEFFVFTDDIEYAKFLLKDVQHKLTFVSHNSGKDSWKDMLLMMNCKHLIIANSTFSWWAGYLNSCKGMIIVPEWWARNKRSSQLNLFKDSWKIIDFER